MYLICYPIILLFFESVHFQSVSEKNILEKCILYINDTQLYTENNIIYFAKNGFLRGNNLHIIPIKDVKKKNSR